MDLTANVMAANQSATLQSANIKIMKKQHEMQQSMIDVIAKTTSAALPSTQGLVVDKTV